MSTWGSRTRGKKRQLVLPKCNETTIKENILKKQRLLTSNKKLNSAKLALAITSLEAATRALPEVRDTIHQRRDNRRRLEQLRTELGELQSDRPFTEFVERLGPLLKNIDQSSQAKKVIFLNLFHEAKVSPCFIDKETCKACRKEFLFNVRESMLVCPGCGAANTLIYCKTDYNENVEQNKNPYERSPLYRKYLMQFHEDANPVPPDVINAVYKHLSKVHIMLTSKVKPTPIAQILREEGLQKWTPFAVRITKIINKEHIVALPQDLIDRLVERFDKISQAFTSCKAKERKKIMNFEFLTKQFLHMEQRHDLAEWFCCHKTRKVLQQADVRLLKCSRELDSTDTVNWDVTRSC